MNDYFFMALMGVLFGLLLYGLYNFSAVRWLAFIISGLALFGAYKSFKGGHDA